MVTGNEVGIPGCLWESKGPAYHTSSCALGKNLLACYSLSFAVCKMGVINVTDLRGVNNCRGSTRRATGSAPAHRMSSISGGILLPVPLQFAAGIQVSGAGSFAVGASCESHSAGPGSLPNPTVEAVNLAVASGTGPLAVAF